MAGSSGNSGGGGSAGSAGADADAGSDGSDDLDGSVPDQDANVDAGDGSVEQDASDEDANKPTCGNSVACVCPHLRVDTPNADCVPATCPIAECAPEPECTFKRSESSVYYVCETNHDQATATDFCEGVGMHLVTIDDADEEELLLEGSSGRLWIGAERNDDYGEAGAWQWLEGTLFWDLGEDAAIDGAYVSWAPSEPNNIGNSPGQVDCVVLRTQTSDWADTNCNESNGYVCELED